MKQHQHQWKPLLLVACIFLFSGAAICMNDMLLPAVKALFSLSYVQASLVQQSFYLVYLLFPIPIAYFISRCGYKTALVSALLICSGASLLFIPAYHLFSLALALVALCIVSIGVTVVNVAANPLAAMLGDEKGAHVRVNIVQLFSRIGFSLTPLVATRLIYADGNTIHFHFPYLVIGGGTLLLAVLLLLAKTSFGKAHFGSEFSPFAIIRESKKHPNLRWGIFAMFFYMGAEACTAGFFISYLKDVAMLSDELAARYLSAYYLVALVFSFAGVFLIHAFKPRLLLIIFSMGLLALYLLAAFATGGYNLYFMVGMGVFISILFSLIFSLSIEGIGSFTERGSALINMAIVGGAVFPPLQGMLADAKGVQQSYIIPGFCVLVIIGSIVYGSWKREKSVG